MRMRLVRASVLSASFGLTSALAAQSVRDSSSANPASLSGLLERASHLNELPPHLMAYKARVETEVAILLRREDGSELVAAMEQIASNFRWTRSGYYDQRVIGHRVQQSALTISALSIAPTGWIQPTLYGSRFRLRNSVASDTGKLRQRNRDGADTMAVVHPLADDRAAWYQFSGGDTTVTIRLGEREIPIVRIRVQPRKGLTTRVLLFDGEISLDAARATLVRVRGHFVRAGGRKNPLDGIATAVAFVEYEQGERSGAYWLPSRQRIELQAAAPILGEGRAVIRIASRILDMVVNDTVLDSNTVEKSDSLRQRSRRKLTYAPTDSLGRFTDWQLGQGVITQDMHSDDFDDIGPDRWRPTGRPRFDIGTMRPADAMHFNRVEGFYTGAGVRLALRDVAPGVVVRANAGYAWAEQTARGRFAVERTRGSWKQEFRTARSLDVTNDFRVHGDSGPGFWAVMYTSDPYDYVDRYSVTTALMRNFASRHLVARAEIGLVRDGYRPAFRERGTFGRPLFRENRNVDEGSYLRTTASLELRPDVNAEFVKPGIGARLWYERGDGELDWQRAELRVVARHARGPLIATTRFDVGSLFGSRLPPQQLFELAKSNLPGYSDREFAGSRAALLRAKLQYIGPYLRQPLKIPVVDLYFPGVAPGLSIGMQAGWAEVSGDAARSSVERLRPPPGIAINEEQLPGPTERVRATTSVGFTLFSGLVFVGFSRPLDQSTPWTFGFGSGY